EAELPRVLEEHRAAEANAAVHAHVPVSRERHVGERQKVFVPANRDAVLADAAEAEQDALVELGVNRARFANRLREERLGQRLQLETVDRDDPEAFAREVMRERVTGRSQADDEDVLAVVRAHVRALDVQRVEALQEEINLDAPREREHLGEDARLDLRDVDRLLLLEDAGLHAVVADAVTGAGAHRVVDAHDREGAERVAALPHRVHLADLLAERAAVEENAEGVLLHLLRLWIAQALRAGVLLAVVAKEAVVN